MQACSSDPGLSAIQEPNLSRLSGVMGHPQNDADAEEGPNGPLLSRPPVAVRLHMPSDIPAMSLRPRPPRLPKKPAEP